MTFRDGTRFQAELDIDSAELDTKWPDHTRIYAEKGDDWNWDEPLEETDE